VILCITAFHKYFIEWNTVCLRALACVADRVLFYGIVLKKPVIAGYSTGCGNGGGHRREHPIPVEYMCRVTKQGLTSHGPAIERGCLADVWVRLTTAKCHWCEGRSEGVYKEDETGRVSADRKLRASMECGKKIRRHENQQTGAVINILRLLTPELDGTERPASLRTEILDRKRKPSKSTLAEAGVDGKRNTHML